MAAKVRPMKKIANPTIEAVLQQYLDECQAAKKPAQKDREHN
jgi:hypothetical protein